MDKDSYRQRRRKKLIKARRRKRHRQIISISLVVIVLLFIITKISSHFSKSKDREISPALMWYYTNIIDPNRSKRLFYESKYISNLALEPIRDIKKEFIVKGSNHLAKASGYAYDTKEIREYTRKNNYNGDKKLVFLTFDDGPNNSITPQVLNILEKEKVHATFFLVGKSVTEGHSQVIKDILKKGHSIATHSFSHEYDYLYPQKVVNPIRVYDEIEKTNKRLENIISPNFHSSVFRYPGGEMSWKNTNASNKFLEEKGIHWIDWNCLVGDAERKSVRPSTPQGFVEYVDKSLNKNKNTKIAVVLMHDAENKKLTVDSLPHVIKYFKDKGYNFGVLK